MTGPHGPHGLHAPGGPGLRVAVIGGGASCEHEVSLASAASVAAALETAGHHVVRLTIGRDGGWSDPGGRPVGLGGALRLVRSCDVVLPVVHGPRGEDGTLAALCELAGRPYVGSGVRAGALAMDKWATKLVAAAMGISTAPGVVLTRSEAGSQTWTHPVVVKPVAAGSSHGVALVSEARSLPPALAAAFALGERVLVEDVVVGREVDVAVLGRSDGTRVVAPMLEVVVEGVFDVDDKYGGGADFRVPAALEQHEQRALRESALRMYDAIGCAGVARVDFFLTVHGPVLNEVNTAPGFTEHSQVPRMFAATGLSYPDLVDLLVRDVVA